MYARLITKSGDAIWYRTGEPILGRRELADQAFQKWELAQALKTRGDSQK